MPNGETAGNESRLTITPSTLMRWAGLSALVAGICYVLVGVFHCEVDQGGFIRVDATGQTSVPGVWAVGNFANPRAQLITAAGEGSAAAIAINNDLVQEDVRDALRQSRATAP
jgi:pyruvate/2-oxoglutarate dehydrogenase complex dihydrolipoamide dehydrogenase (E3) component